MIPSDELANSTRDSQITAGTGMQEVLVSIADLLESVQFVVDSQGEKRAAILESSTWETVLTLLEDLEDTEELRQVRQERDENLPWEQVKADYRQTHS